MRGGAPYPATARPPAGKARTLARGGAPPPGAAGARIVVKIAAVRRFDPD